MDTKPRTPTRVTRSRLLHRVAADVDAGANVIMFAALPGSGKTTTLAQWADRRRAVGEIVVELGHESGGSTADLWPALTAAVRSTMSPSEARATIAALSQIVNSTSASDAASVDIRTLSNQSLWIAIDDVQQWRSAIPAQQLGRLISAATPDLRIALSGRHVAHSLVSTPLLSGTATAYRSADLAFDADEARTLLLAHEVVLSGEDLTTLLRRTEGWAAGLRLAALALVGENDRSAFVAHFAGTDRSVGDYLVTEVLSRLSADVVDLLLDISVADEIHHELARLLSGRPEAVSILDELVDTNALIHVSRSDPECYELHPLFRTYLQAEERRRDEGRQRRGHAVAASWYERNGDPRHAIRHATRSDDWARVQSLVAAYSVPIILTHGPWAMRETLAALPAAIQSLPAIAGAAALTATVDGNLPAADLDAAVLDAASNAADAGRRLAIRAVIDLAYARSRSMSRQQVEAALASVELVEGEDPSLVLLGRAVASMAFVVVGDLAAAVSSAESTARIARRRGLDFLLLQCLGTLSLAAGCKAAFSDVRRYATEAVGLAERHGWDRMPRMAQFHGNLAAAAWQDGDGDGARFHAQAAVDVADPDSDPVSAASAQVLYDLTNTPDGHLDLTVGRHLNDFNALWPLLPPSVIALDACVELMVCLRAQETDIAASIIRRADELLPGAPDVRVFKAMRHVYQGRETLAAQDLDGILDSEQKWLMPWSHVITWAITADLADSSGRRATAHDALMHALRHGEPDHLVRPLVDATPSMHRLLSQEKGRFGRYEPYVADLLAFAASRPFDRHGTGLVLTDREAAILRDLPSLMSLREIAEAHVVSINTVKSHLKSAYRKLGVASRREAVDHAREIGLI